MPLPESVLAKAGEIVARYPQPRSALMPLLFLWQAEQGYVSPEAVRHIADLLAISTAEVGAVVTFYVMFHRRPVGRHLVSVCRTFSCVLRGAEEVTDALLERFDCHLGEPTSDGLITVEQVECLAACDGAPVVQVNYENYEGLTPDAAVALVERFRAGELPDSSFAAQGSRPDPSAVAAYWRLAGLGEPPERLAQYLPAADAPTAFPPQPPAPSIREDPTSRTLLQLRTGIDHGGTAGRGPGSSRDAVVVMAAEGRHAVHLAAPASADAEAGVPQPVRRPGGDRSVDAAAQEAGGVASESRAGGAPRE